jgi:hypothetical protein
MRFLSALDFGYTTTATAASTTTLTAASNNRQVFTGSTTQTVTLPVTSTLQLGRVFTVVNNSTGTLTVNSSGGNLVLSIAAGMTGTLTCILTSGTSAASWTKEISGASGTTGTGNLVFGTSPTLVTPALGTPASGNLANCTFPVIPLASGGSGKTSAPAAAANFNGFTTTATAASTTTLDNTSSVNQVFTGTTTQTITLPVTSTLATGWTFRIKNNSTGLLTVNSSGANLVAVIPPGFAFTFQCILTNNNTAAAWDVTSDAKATPNGNPLVATGTISNGAAVALRTDGTVEVVAGSLTNTLGTKQQIATPQVSAVTACFDSTSGKVVVFYTDVAAGQDLYYVVGTISGTGITFGTPDGTAWTIASSLHCCSIGSSKIAVVVSSGGCSLCHNRYDFWHNPNDGLPRFHSGPWPRHHNECRVE